VTGLLFDFPDQGDAVSQQVKVPADIKREVELCSAISGQTQGQLLAAAWREYREHHKDDFREGLNWARSVLGDAAEAAVAASGMSEEDLAEISEALGDTAPTTAAAKASS
jgi:hypothetical protein